VVLLSPLRLFIARALSALTDAPAPRPQVALEQGEEDLKRTGIAAVAAAGVVLALQGEFLHEHWQSAMWATFALGYIGIIFEEVTGGESTTF